MSYDLYNSYNIASRMKFEPYAAQSVVDASRNSIAIMESVELSRKTNDDEKCLEIRDVNIKVVNRLSIQPLLGCGELSGLDFRKTKNYMTLSGFKIPRVLIRDW